MPKYTTIDEADYWWFVEIYSILAALADKPSHVISRLGGGRILVAEELATQLHQIYRAIIAKYPRASEWDVIKISAEIDSALAERSADGELFDKTFWSNAGFIRHPNWLTIRTLARSFLIR